MISEINRIDIAQADRHAFEAAFAQCIPLLLRVDGCEAVTLLHCVERPGHYLIRVEWRHLGDHVDTYPQTPEAAKIRALLRPFIKHADPAHFETIEHAHRDAPAGVR